jgi:hypothetical protein
MSGVKSPHEIFRTFEEHSWERPALDRLRARFSASTVAATAAGVSQRNPKRRWRSGNETVYLSSQPPMMPLDVPWARCTGFL